MYIYIYIYIYIYVIYICCISMLFIYICVLYIIHIYIYICYIYIYNIYIYIYICCIKIYMLYTTPPPHHRGGYHTMGRGRGGWGGQTDPYIYIFVYISTQDLKMHCNAHALTMLWMLWICMYSKGLDVSPASSGFRSRCAPFQIALNTWHHIKSVYLDGDRQ